MFGGTVHENENRVKLITQSNRVFERFFFLEVGLSLSVRVVTENEFNFRVSKTNETIPCTRNRHRSTDS